MTFKLFKRDEETLKRLEKEDVADRIVSEIHTTFTTVLGEIVSYTSYYMLNKLVNGLDSFQELELLESNITVRGITYNTDHIVTLQSKVTGERVVKKEVKKSEGSFWGYRRNFSEDELEI